MGMSTEVYGIKPPDGTWEKMKAIWDNCVSLRIPIPAEVNAYFDGADPDPAGVVVEVPHQNWGDDYRQGFQIYVDKIPADVQVLRFYNSW